MGNLWNQLKRFSLVQRLLSRLEDYNLFRWLGKGFWAIMDKGLYGASNFILNVLLARWISEQAYGAFTVAFSVFILLLAFYIALFTEPMLVFGSSRYTNRFREYIGVLLHGHLGFTLLSSLILFGIGLLLTVWGNQALALAFWGLALAIPFVLYGWLMRQACYVPNRPRLAAGGGAIYMLVVFLGAYLVYQQNWLSPLSIFLVMAVAGLLSGAAIAGRLGIRWMPLRTDRFRLDILKRHWTYGRWAAAARIPMRAPGSIILMVLPIWGGLAASGTLKALMNLVQPLLQTTAALGILLVPRLTQVRNQPRLFTLTRIMLVLFTGAGLAYWLTISSLSGPIVEWLYNGQYVRYAHLLWILGLQAVLTAAIEVINATLRATEKPNWIFWAYTISASVGLPVSLLLIAFAGLEGAVVGNVVLYLATLAAMVFFYRRLKNSLLEASNSSVVDTPVHLLSSTSSEPTK